MCPSLVPGGRTPVPAGLWAHRMPPVHDGTRGPEFVPPLTHSATDSQGRPRREANGAVGTLKGSSGEPLSNDALACAAPRYTSFDGPSARAGAE
eukprot:2379640-Prymnesium_polylepis.1